jgi:uncharacterized cupredoxin-like copper-binding protein
MLTEDPGPAIRHGLILEADDHERARQRVGSKKQRNGTTQARLERAERQRRVERRRTRVRRRMLTVVAALLVVATIAVIVATHSSDASRAAPYEGTTLEVSLGDFDITGNLTAPAGKVRLHAVDRGGATHNVGLRGGPITTNLQPGDDAMLDLGNLAPGTYELYCDVADHVQRGMVAQLVITPT